MLKWVRYPRAWRHKTRMPNFWPAPLDPASKLPYAEASPEYPKWEAQHEATRSLAIASFLVERSERPRDAPRQRRATRSRSARRSRATATSKAPAPTRASSTSTRYGCRGCHATSEDNPPAAVAQPRARRRAVARQHRRQDERRLAHLLGRGSDALLARHAGCRTSGSRASRRPASRKYLLTLKDEPKDAAQGDGGRGEPPRQRRQAQREGRLRRGRAGRDARARQVRREAHRLLRLLRLPQHRRLRELRAHRARARAAGPRRTSPSSTTATPSTITTCRRTRRSWRGSSTRRASTGATASSCAWPTSTSRRARSARSTVFVMGLVESQAAARATTRRRKPEYAVVARGAADRRRLQLPRLPRHRRSRRRLRDRGRSSSTSRTRPPFLTGEGMRVQPEWLFNFLRDPRKNAHPSVPPPGVGVRRRQRAGRQARRCACRRSPSRASRPRRIVRYFAGWDGQEYPYQTAHTHTPTHRAEALRRDAHELGAARQLHQLPLRGRVPRAARQGRSAEDGAEPRQRVASVFARSG